MTNFEEISASMTTQCVLADGTQPKDVVAENGKNFTTVKHERTKRARTLHHNAGAPDIEMFKDMSQTNWTQDSPGIKKDINTATEKWGPGVAHLKNKHLKNKST